MNIRKGDTVIVISGNDKGKTGKVLFVDSKNQRVVVEGVNVRTKHMKPSNANPDGGIVKKECPIHVSNVALVDPKTGEATRVHHALKDGKKVRVATKTGNIIE